MHARNTKVTTSHWGAFNVTTENGRIIEVSPFAKDPNPSSISSLLPKAVHHHTRVAKPSIRRGWLKGGQNRERDQRGRDTFLEVPWDEALDIVASEIKRVCREHGNNTIFGGSYGWGSAGRFHHAQSHGCGKCPSIADGPHPYPAKAFPPDHWGPDHFDGKDL